ncbi:MAG: methionyl-tRNA formyltransferase [Litoreibacter sp.]
MRLVFMGTPDFSVPILQALVDAGHEIAAVYSQPPRPAGRGKKLRPSPVHALAETLGIPVRHPVSLKAVEDQHAFVQLQAEVAVVVAYGLILPQAVLDAPQYGCLNIHASLLPRWRGAAPIHRAIMAGDTKTGICIMQMEAGLDTGPVLLRREVDIGAEETTLELHNRLSLLGAETITHVVGGLTNYLPVLQPDEGITYAHKIDKAEAEIDWSEPAEVIDRQIRGLSPFPGAWTTLHGERVKCLASRVSSQSGAAGVLIKGLTIACGSGSVEVLRAQRAGKSAQSIDDFLHGQPIPIGTQFGD